MGRRGKSKNTDYNKHEMYFGLKFRRLFKIWSVKTTEQNQNKKLNTVNKKVTG